MGEQRFIITFYPPIEGARASPFEREKAMQASPLQMDTIWLADAFDCYCFVSVYHLYNRTSL